MTTLCSIAIYASCTINVNNPHFLHSYPFSIVRLRPIRFSFQMTYLTFTYCHQKNSRQFSAYKEVDIIYILYNIDTRYFITVEQKATSNIMERTKP